MTHHRENPFTVGRPVPPERFIGRTQLIEEAFDQIYNRGNLALWGSAGIGKTSFLKYLTEHSVWERQGLDPTEAVIVFVDCSTILPFSSSNFWKEILKEIQSKTLTLKEKIDTLLSQKQFTSDAITQVIDCLSKQDKYLVLLVDEYNVACQSIHGDYNQEQINHFLYDCRTLALRHNGKSFSMIVVTSERLSDLGPSLSHGQSPWYNHYLFRQIKLLSGDEIDQLLIGLPRNPEFRERIHQLADGNPVLLQNAGFLLYRLVRSDYIPSPEDLADQLREATHPFIQRIWQQTTPEEKTLLMLVAIDRLKGRAKHQKFSIQGLEALFSQQEQKLSHLVSEGILNQIPPQQYVFNSEMMEWWVQIEVKNTTDDEIEGRRRKLLGMITNHQIDQIKQISQFMRDNPQIFQGIYQGLGKLIDLIQ